MNRTDASTLHVHVHLHPRLLQVAFTKPSLHCKHNASNLGDSLGMFCSARASSWSDQLHQRLGKVQAFVW